MSTLTCKEVILNYLSDYLDATLSREAAADLEQHLACCKPCQTYLDTYRRTRDLVGQSAAVAMPAEMKAHVRYFLLNQLAKR